MIHYLVMIFKIKNLKNEQIKRMFNVVQNANNLLKKMQDAII